MKRFELLQSLQPSLLNSFVVCNIGIPSQELYKLGDRDNYFYMLGSMGLCSSIGLGISFSTKSSVVAIEGDGALLMNLGSLATMANYAPDNYTLLVVDNGTYGSTGDQPTHTQGKTSLAKVAEGAGCNNVFSCTGQEASLVLQKAIGLGEFSVIIVTVEPGNEPADVIPLHAVTIRDRFRNSLSAGEGNNDYR